MIDVVKRAPFTFVCALLMPLLSGCEPSLVADAKNHVRAHLNAWESAAFENVERCGHSNVVSGEVKAHETLSGHATRQRFYFADSVVEMTAAGHRGPLQARCNAAVEELRQLSRDSVPLDEVASSKGGRRWSSSKSQSENVGKIHDPLFRAA